MSRYCRCQYYQVLLTPGVQAYLPNHLGRLRVVNSSEVLLHRRVVVFLLVIQIVAISSEYHILLLDAHASLLSNLYSKNIEVFLIDQLKLVCQ